MFVLKYSTGNFYGSRGVTQAVGENSSWIWGLPDPHVLLRQAEAGAAEIPRLESS